MNGNKKRKEDESRKILRDVTLSAQEVSSELEDTRDKDVAFDIIVKVYNDCHPQDVRALEGKSDLITLEFMNIASLESLLLFKLMDMFPQIFDMDVVFPKLIGSPLVFKIDFYKARVSNKKTKGPHVMKIVHELEEFTVDKLQDTLKICNSLNDDFPHIKEICKEIHNMDAVMPSIQMTVGCIKEADREEMMYMVKFYRMEHINYSFIKHLTTKFDTIWDIQFNAKIITDVYMMMVILSEKTKLKRLRDPTNENKIDSVGGLVKNMMGFVRKKLRILTNVE